MSALLAEARTAAESGDDDRSWSAISALHLGGSETAFRQAVAWCASSVALERALGIDVLAQLGGSDDSNPFRDQSRRLAMGLLGDTSVEVLRSATLALSHLGVHEDLERVAALAGHRDAAVRHGVVRALTSNDAPLSVATLILLSSDVDDLVRDWATFALGAQTELDTPELREALAARLDDPCDDARAEAVVGLASRGDTRAPAAVLHELESECVGRLAVEVARDYPSVAYREALLALRSWWDLDTALLEDAIERCGTAAEPSA